jgi:uncharacterized protein (TIGR00730 family)
MNPYIGHIKFKNIAFFGDADVSAQSREYKDAFEVAKLLASRGFTIVNGGGPGIMDASTKGAQAADGETISVTFDPKDAPGFEGRYLGNITDHEIKTTNYIERMFKLIEHSDIFIIFRGGTGTLSELGTAWVLAKLYYGHHKPFILFGKNWPAIIDVLRRNMNLDKNELSVFEICEDISQVLPAIQRLKNKLESFDHSKCLVCDGDECAFRK